MGFLFVVNLEGKIYSCKHCQTHLALSDDIVSKDGYEEISRSWWYLRLVCHNKEEETDRNIQAFHCRHGKAYLFSKVVNVFSGLNEERMMTTGMHTVADIFCVKCGSIVGWKYEAAREKGQKYKEGKFILERFKVSGPDGTNYWVSPEAQVGGSDADDA